MFHIIDARLTTRPKVVVSHRQSSLLFMYWSVLRCCWLLNVNPHWWQLDSLAFQSALNSVISTVFPLKVINWTWHCWVGDEVHLYLVCSSVTTFIAFILLCLIYPAPFYWMSFNHFPIYLPDLIRTQWVKNSQLTTSEYVNEDKAVIRDRPVCKMNFIKFKSPFFFSNYSHGDKTKYTVFKIF